VEAIELPSGRKIGPGEPCFVVAEIGQNHNGHVYSNAVELLKHAHEAGVDAVKLCKRHIPSDLARVAYERPYENDHSYGGTYGEHREALELPIDDYVHLLSRMDYNHWHEVLFATACDIVSANELEENLDPPMYKIASRDLDNIPLINHVASFGKPVILSTGMNLDLEAAIRAVRRHHDQLIVLYCVSEYPTPYEHIDLGWMNNIRESFDCLVGFSDHTDGIVASQAAAMMGAVVIEKHITLHRSSRGTDHAGSLEPHGLAKLVRNIRDGEKMRRPLSGREAQDACSALTAAHAKLGRSLVATKDVAKGQVVTEDMVTLKSPGTGVSYHDRSQIIGQPSPVAVAADELFERVS